MPGGCILRVSGAAFRVDAYLADSGLVPCAVWHPGERRLKSLPASTTAGFNAVVTDADDLTAQTSAAVAFLHRHRGELLRLSGMAEVTDRVLDFAVARRDVSAQFAHFPVDLVRTAGELRMAIELSQYAVSNDR